MTEQQLTIAALEADTIQGLVGKIGFWHQSAISLATQSLDFAFKCGHALLEAKTRVGHGAWLEWREKNIPGISERTCQVYMKVAREWDTIKATAGEGLLTIEGALSLTATPRPKTEAMSDDMPPRLEIALPALDEQLSLSNPQSPADLNSNDVGMVNVPHVPELTRTDPAPDDSLSQQHSTFSAVVGPVIRSQEAGEVSNEAEAAVRGPKDAQANLARLKQVHSNLTTAISRVQVVAQSLVKQIGDHQFVSALHTLSQGNERLWQLRQDWEMKAGG